jgi:hypothetical protein
LKNLWKIVSAGTLLLTAVACTHHPANYSDRSEANLIGLVQSIVDKDPFYVTSLSYNRTGSLTEMTRECLDEAACTNGPRATSMKFKLDNSGRKVSAEEQDRNGLTRFREAYSFDEAGHPTARVRASPTGEFIYGDFSWYDHRGYRAGEIIVVNVRELLGSESMAEKSENFYDAQGRATKQIKYDLNGRKRAEVVKTYDNSGHLQDETSYSSEGRIRGRKLYDYQGAKLQEHSFDESGELYLKYEYSYEYDQLNNWTKRLMKVWEKRDGVLAHTYTMVNERSISYYP